MANRGNSYFSQKKNLPQISMNLKRKFTAVYAKQYKFKKKKT